MHCQEYLTPCERDARWNFKSIPWKAYVVRNCVASFGERKSRDVGKRRTNVSSFLPRCGFTGNAIRCVSEVTATPFVAQFRSLFSTNYVAWPIACPAIHRAIARWRCRWYRFRITSRRSKPAVSIMPGGAAALSARAIDRNRTCANGSTIIDIERITVHDEN